MSSAKQSSQPRDLVWPAGSKIAFADLSGHVQRSFAKLSRKVARRAIHTANCAQRFHLARCEVITISEEREER